MNNTTVNFNYFNEIETTSLRIFNLVVTFSNLKSDFGDEVAKAYVENLSQVERKQMFLVLAAIKKDGVEAVRKSIVKDIPLEDEVIVSGN